MVHGVVARIGSEKWQKYIEIVNEKFIESAVSLKDGTVAKVGMHVEAQVDSTQSRNNKGHTVINYSKGHTGEIVGFEVGPSRNPLKGLRRQSSHPGFQETHPIVR